MGVQVVEAANGVMGLALARHYQPNAIVLDVHMKDKGGLETLREIRSDARTETIPVVMLTVDAKREVISQAMDCSIEGYLVKPVTAKRLRQMLKPILGRRRPRRNRPTSG